MIDVFISYASTRREETSQLARMLGMERFTVWWDTHLTAGDRFNTHIPEQLAIAKSVVVIWTPESIGSTWVLSEAKRALSQGKLIPVRTQDLPVAKIPAPFDVLHTVPIDEFGNIVKAINNLVEKANATSVTEGYDFSPNSEARPGAFHPDGTFSKDLTAYFRSLNKLIEKLTEDQINCFLQLGPNSRMLVDGCAGSGKTLVAMEAAIRLANASFKVGFFCHSPVLTRFVTEALSQTANCEVHYFYEFISQLAGTYKAPSYVDWQVYEEPSEQEINDGFDRLTLGGHNAVYYDAIVVDEGQDFRSDWLLLLEATLKDQASSLMYVFYDERQAFVKRGPIDFSAKKCVLNRNIRNAGNVFDIVQRFHPMAPPKTSFLQGKGFAEVTVCKLGEELIATEAVLGRVKAKTGLSSVVVLTSESGGLINSRLIRHGFDISRRPDWRGAVRAVAEQYKLAAVRQTKERFPYEQSVSDADHARRSAIVDTIRSINLKPLSDQRRPSETDFARIKEFGTSVLEALELRRSKLGPETHFATTWTASDLRFIKSDTKFSYGRGRPITEEFICSLDELRFEELAYLLIEDGCLSASPAPEFVYLKPYWLFAGRQDELALYEVAQYKGLEADVIVLVIPDVVSDIAQQLYVGASRARGYLELVISEPAYARAPRLRK